MSGTRSPAVYNIPPDVEFLRALVRAILEGRLFGEAAPDSMALSRWTIMLPTRRSVRALRETFMQVAPGEARMLPVIRALGDVDEDELIIHAGASEIELPPAASDHQRQFMLAGMVREWAVTNPASHAAQIVSGSVAQALRMATSMMQLIDHLDNGDISLADVPAALLNDSELPLHHEEAIGFLSIIAERYPAAMRDAGLLGPAERRARLLRLEAERLAANPPDAPVIAAGSTGSLPATAALLHTVACLPQGCVVLPGLDTSLDEESWQALGEQHPQFGLRELLHLFGITRDDVQALPGIARRDDGKPRVRLASELMRPTETTHKWHDLREHKPTLEQACRSIRWLEAPDMREQALMIALAMRKALHEDRRCALITPDRQLARRVSAELARWNVHVDDSAGEPLSMHPAGVFFELVSAASLPDAAPESVVALLTHPLIGEALAPDDDPRLLARELEIAVFRQLHEGHRLHNLTAGLARAREVAGGQHADPALKRIAESGRWPVLEAYAARLEALFNGVCGLASSVSPHPLKDMLHAHITLAEALASDGEDTPQRLWLGEAGQALSSLLRALLDEADAAPAMPLADYCTWIADGLRQVPVRRRFPLHPSLSILGLLEARLVQPDMVILGGLNEGVWPAAADPGPWLSRPQHQMLKLALPERRLGLAAHDFAQSLCAGEVVLAWTRKAGGTPLVPSRWLLRLNAVLQAAGLKDAAQPDETLAAIAHQLDKRGSAQGLPVEPPEPKPPVSSRPKRLSVTRIARLLRDPYWAYAYYVLGLRPLPPLGRVPGPAERGQLAHKVVERFAREYPDAMPDNAAEILCAMAEEETARTVPDAALRTIWGIQLARAMDWFAGRDSQLRETVQKIHVEIDGRLDVPIGSETFTISAKADRIDELTSGNARIIDYKTGTATFSKKTAQNYSPQLDLEGWILQEGGFKGIAPQTASELMYIRLSGGHPPGELIESRDQKFPTPDRIETAASGFRQLMASYQRPERGYPARTGDEAWGRRSDYDHLSRWREWGLGRDGSGEGDSE
ncbi:MAG: double-strand break repair protein AddB [Anderseniella sp.]|nr:double-strand break repair protein AddB [Anderseniella sp.]